MLLTPERPPEQQTFLDRLTAASAIFATARGLAERFTILLRKRPREDAHGPLGLWVAAALSSSFARGLRDDWEAVVAGLSLKWSQGPVEGAGDPAALIRRVVARPAQVEPGTGFPILIVTNLPAEAVVRIGVVSVGDTPAIRAVGGGGLQVSSGAFDAVDSVAATGVVALDDQANQSLTSYSLARFNRANQSVSSAGRSKKT